MRAARAQARLSAMPAPHTSGTAILPLAKSPLSSRGLISAQIDPDVSNSGSGRSQATEEFDQRLLGIDRT